MATTMRGRSKPEARILKYKETRKGRQARIAMVLSTHGVMKKPSTEKVERPSLAG
jgi:hypothetical protein